MAKKSKPQTYTLPRPQPRPFAQPMQPMSPQEIQEKLSAQVPDLPDGTKVCTGFCGESLPATTDYFDRDATREDGLRQVCKVCRAKERQVAAYQAVDDRVHRLDERSLQLLDNLARAGSEIPHIAEIYQRLMEVFEGAGGFAAHLMGQYLMAKPGSQARTRILGDILRLSIKVSESGTAQLPIDLMADEDLAIMFEKGMQKFVPRIIHDHDGAAQETA